MEGIHRQATLLFVLNSKLYQEIPPPSWKSSETEVVYETVKWRKVEGTREEKLLILIIATLLFSWPFKKTCLASEYLDLFVTFKRSVLKSNYNFK